MDKLQWKRLQGVSNDLNTESYYHLSTCATYSNPLDNNEQVYYRSSR